MSLLIWKIASSLGLGLTLQDCESETLFPVLERAIGSYTKEFTMNAHDTLYVSQVADYLGVNRSIVGTSDFATQDNAIDGDLDTATTFTADNGTGKEIIIDFGSAAVRTLIAKVGTKSASSISTVKWEYALSTDDITYGTPVQISNPTVDTNEQINTVNLGNLASHRYVKLIFTYISGTANPLGRVYELHEPDPTTLIQFEIKDDARGQWIETSPVAFATVITIPSASDVQTEKVTRITTLSNCVAGKLRCKLIITNGRSKDSVFVIKHGKQA